MKITNSHLNFKANKMPYNQAKFFRDKLLASKNVDIFCHELTDKDAANSALVIGEYLEAQGVNARIILSQDLKALDLKNKNCEIIQADDFEPDNSKDSTVLCVDFNSKARISKKIYQYLKSFNKIYGIDHHVGIDLVDNDYVCIASSFKDENPVDFVSSYYVDTTAKSATAIIYRLFEALGEEITNEQAYAIFSGLMSDCNKKGLVKCDGEKETIELKNEFIEDENTYEIYRKLTEKLTPEQIKQIAKKIDLISNLTLEQKEFKESLKDRLVLTKNKKIAYLEIPPDDKQWESLGADNAVTSTILNRFRVDVINNKFNDKELENISLVLTFYKAGENYRISAHSKDNTLLDFFEYAQQRTQKETFESMGGHPSRGGGKITTTYAQVCHKWVEDIVSSADFYD